MKRTNRSRPVVPPDRSRSLPRRRARGASAPIDIEPRIEQRMRRFRVPLGDLRWRCDPSSLPFRSTRELSAGGRFIGQGKALRTLRMGLAMPGPGYNVFVCALAGTRKVEWVVEHLRSAVRGRRSVPDRCYVQNFRDPQRPILLELPPGKGRRFQSEISGLLAQLNSRLDGKPERRWRSLAREVLDVQLPRIAARYTDEKLLRWLKQWKRAILGGIHHASVEDFEVNCLGQAERRRGPVVLTESQPTHANLFGWIGRRPVGGDQNLAPHFTEIRRGTFLEADGGVLVLDANDLVSSPGAWATLKSCLRYGRLEIQHGDPSAPARTGVLKPEPIACDVKLVLVADYGLYDYLFDGDPDFTEIFKIRVDFQSEMPLTSRVLQKEYPQFLAGICQSERLRPMRASAVAKVMEHAVRWAGRKRKISAQAASVIDLLREADYWARCAGRREVTAGDVDRAQSEAIDRVNQVERKIAEMIAEGTILISTGGSRVGQVNGLAIYDMGDYCFGKPSRVTCETSVGQGGIINIERESGFSGRSHDKGVQILGGYLRSCFAQSRPLSLTASVCFEQSYSGIDGDSASSTEIFALLSSLAGLPIRQDLAVTGSMSQKGDIQPIGGVNEKIEGFFDCIRAGRRTGHEGVVIPRKNVVDLMLRPDVVDAVRRGTFHIYAIDKVTEGIEILTGRPAGRRGRSGRYTPGSVFDLVDRRLEMLASDLRKYENGDS